MEQKEEKQQRKARAKNGEKTSKMMAFRIDGDLLEWLKTIPNKGRLINTLLHREKDKKPPRFGDAGWEDEDEQPDRRNDYKV